ncbi:hypothetical protein [Mycolicibacterium thermoresistibile]
MFDSEHLNAGGGIRTVGHRLGISRCDILSHLIKVATGLGVAFAPPANSLLGKWSELRPFGDCDLDQQVGEKGPPAPLDPVDAEPPTTVLNTVVGWHPVTG